MKCERELEVVKMKIETREDDANGGVEGRSRGDGGIIFGGNDAIEGGIGAANVRDRFGVEFLLDAGFAEDKDSAPVRWEVEDA